MRHATALLTAGAVLVSAAIAIRWKMQPRQPATVDIPLPADLARLDPSVAQVIAGAAQRVAANNADASAWRQLGMAYHANGILDLARDCHSRAVDIDPLDPRAWHHLALVQDSLGQFSDAIDSMQRVGELEPGYSPAHWRIGFWALEHNDLEAAERSFARALELQPADPAPHVGLARTHLQRNNPADAADTLSRLVDGHASLGPNEAYINWLLASAERRCGRLDRAQAAAERGDRGFDQQPHWRDPWADEMGVYYAGVASGVAQAQALAARANHDQASAFLEELRGHYPNNVPLLLTLASCQRDQRQFDKSLATLAAAAAISPDSAYVHTNLALTHLRASEALAAVRANAARRLALQHAQQALRLNPALPAAHAANAEIKLASGDFRAAVVAYEAAARCDADPTAWEYKAATIMAEHRQWRQAAELLKRVTHRAPRHVEAWLLLGKVHASSGEVEHARTALDHASRVRPDHPEIERAHRA